MKIKLFILQFIAAALLTSGVYALKQYQNIPEAKTVYNRIDYYMMHNSDIRYVVKNCYYNAVNLLDMVLPDDGVSTDTLRHIFSDIKIIGE